MFAEIIEGQLVERDTLLEALSLIGFKSPRIAAVGAGGKTTLLKELAAEYKISGQESVVITTTHMKNENTRQFLVNPSIQEILKIQEQEGYVFAGAEAPNGKIKILPQEILNNVMELPCPVLIEADGARRLPVKMPAEHEPVLLPQVNCVLSVYGLDALEEKLQDVCFRAERAANFLHKSVEDKLEAKDIALLALSRYAGRKGVLGHMRYVVMLNKADTMERRRLALRVWKMLDGMKEEYGLQEMRVIVTAR